MGQGEWRADTDTGTFAVMIDRHSLPEAGLKLKPRPSLHVQVGSLVSELFPAMATGSNISTFLVGVMLCLNNT